MKTSKLLLAGLLAIGLSATSQATTVHITGSTACGKALNQAILDYLGAAGGTTLTGAKKYGYDSAAPISNSKNCIFTDGTNFIVTAMTGSEAGVQAVAITTGSGAVPSTLPLSFYDETNASLVAALSGTGTPTLSGSYGGASSKHNVVAEVALADAAQSTSRYTAGPHPYGTYASLADANATDSVKGVGVIQFVWLASNGGHFVGTGTNAGNNMTGTITNITGQQAQWLYVDGETTQSGVAADMFTGNSADNAYSVFPTGRDIGSGTRLNYFLAMGKAANIDNAVQFLPTDSTGTGASTAVTSGNSAAPAGIVKTISTTPAKLFVWPAETINYLPEVAGNGGYQSGGDLSKALGADYSAMNMANATFAGYTPPGFILIGFAGVADSTGGNSACTAGAKASVLAFNGVTYASSGSTSATQFAGDAAIIAGQYTAWGYEHVYYKSTYSGAGKTIADAIAGQLVNETVGFIPLANMGTTSRAKDGGLVNH